MKIPVVVVNESDDRRFEDNCARYFGEGYKLSSSSCGYVPAPYDCNYFIAIFVYEGEQK